MEFYEEAIQNTSTEEAPWYLIPADNKQACRYLVSKIIFEELKKYKDIQYPIIENIESHKKYYKSELEKE